MIDEYIDTDYETNPLVMDKLFMDLNNCTKFQLIKIAMRLVYELSKKNTRISRLKYILSDVIN